MRIKRNAVRLVLTMDGLPYENDYRKNYAVKGWPPVLCRHVRKHADNLRSLMVCDTARTLAESGRGERKSAPIGEWQASSGLQKPAEQLLRTLCAMGQMSRVKKVDPATDSPRKVWHYGFFDAASYYDRVPRSEWPTRGGETVSRGELQRYGGAWDVAEREAVDSADDLIDFARVATGGNRGRSAAALDPRTLAVGIACGRYVVNDDGTISMAVTGWGATSTVGDLDGEPVIPTGETDVDTGLPLLTASHGCGAVADRADPDVARAKFAEMRGEAQYAQAVADTDTVEAPADDVDALRAELQRVAAERDSWRIMADKDDTLAEVQKVRADHLQQVLDNIAAILGADPECNPDVESWARSTVDARKSAARAIEVMHGDLVRIALVVKHGHGGWSDADKSEMQGEARPELRRIIEAALNESRGDSRNLAASIAGVLNDYDDTRIRIGALPESTADAADAIVARVRAVCEMAIEPKDTEELRDVVRQRDVWMRTAQGIAGHMLGVAVGCCDPDTIHRNAVNVFDAVVNDRDVAIDERNRAALRAGSPDRYTPGELRAIRDALESEHVDANESCSMVKRDSPEYADRIERVAHIAAALARTLRALNPA